MVQISIMDYTLFPDHKVFFNDYVPRDKSGYPYTDKLQFLVMDLTQVDGATDEQKKQGLVEWAKAFRANSWEEVNEINNSGVKEAARTMQLIMSNPTECEMIRMRQDAISDWRTMINSERMDATVKTLADLVRDGLLTVDVAAGRANLTVKEFARRAGMKL